MLRFHLNAKSLVQVDVQVSSKHPCCIEVALCCLAAEGDGYGLHEANDGGLLAAIMAAGFKGSKYTY
jgi:nuclear pore complex protein Nup107